MKKPAEKEGKLKKVLNKVTGREVGNREVNNRRIARVAIKEISNQETGRVVIRETNKGTGKINQVNNGGDIREMITGNRKEGSNRVIISSSAANQIRSVAILQTGRRRNQLTGQIIQKITKNKT